eukprot:CAMPEP_0172624394 /NCGR_PEP_ID=MMETSP1068-20121228/136236_1 /TAXON_ID=35684 /ORGANISM="Pseudopedinella elastica, Strain CCMP716" /LENGTH=112 /DNA_ID=CAMNT_0013433335 /DNA_START=66 /DNA_END=400 /DNA_ORIENTATION=-
MVRGTTSRLGAKELVGGGDGSIGGGGGSGDPCIKYLGGPIRRVASLGERPALLLEVCVRAPSGDRFKLAIPRLGPTFKLDEAFKRVELPPNPPEPAPTPAVSAPAPVAPTQP